MSQPQIREPGVVVGVDESPAAIRAVRWGAAEAESLGKPLTLVHVLDTGVGTSLAPGPIAAAEVAVQGEAEGRELLADANLIARQCMSGDQIVHCRLLWGFPGIVLGSLTRRADLLVLGHRQLGPRRDGPLGSVGAVALQHAHCPVVVVRNPVPTAADGAVLVGIDGTPSSEWATALAFDEASRRHATLVALHAWTYSEVADVPSLEESNLRKVGEEILAERLAGWQERYPDVQVHRVVVENEPARHLVERSALAQLTVVGSRGRGRLASLVLGSVSNELIRHGQSPVMVTPAVSRHRRGPTTLSDPPVALGHSK
ncbi:universal stress protein [Mycobacterium sp. OTB74]|uniref:universal stress protein n=1 Tax=Mycobacterium sp. OTB74 TaxID=1853452 RepID=UPI002476B736|nr:universal stress protein [Mycobacterium sp. OTB74]MDH6245703.1 nucleotide-binding universal stress UspA family protein [Mycobacterium sp. OTB74]